MVRLTDYLNITIAIDWDVNQQSKQTNGQSIVSICLGKLIRMKRINTVKPD